MGNVSLSGTANVSPANPDAGYTYLLISGRDLVISGSAQEDTPGCSGSCSSTVPADAQQIGGAYASHEQIGVGGNPNIFGLMVAEEAADCSNAEIAPTKINGSPQIFYDCDHPVNPWTADDPPERVAWQEVE